MKAREVMEHGKVRLFYLVQWHATLVALHHATQCPADVIHETTITTFLGARQGEQVLENRGVVATTEEQTAVTVNKHSHELLKNSSRVRKKNTKYL